MMLRLFNSQLREKGEEGVILILSIFLLIILLALAGLGIDGGNLYRARLQVQKAVDAGALGGIGYIFQFENANPPSETDIENRARDITFENLILAGITLDRVSDIQTDYDPITMRLTVDAQATIPFLIMDAVPFDILGINSTASEAVTRANAVSRRQRANVALVLDISESMACPAESTGKDCSCLTPARTAPCDLSESKLEELKDAVLAFLDEFDPNRDRISMTGFNMAAQVFVPFTSGPTSPPTSPTTFTKADFQTAMSSATFVPQSSTNICDGLLTSFSEVRRVGLDNGTEGEVSYVLFSDGAPTAGRFLLSNPVNALTLDPNDPQGFGSHDYIHYTVQHLVAGPVPSYLVKTGSIPVGHPDANPPAGSLPACYPFATAATFPDPPSNVIDFSDAFDPCINDFGFHAPNNAGLVVGSNYNNPVTYARWKEQYYNCSVSISDALRRRRGMFYVIGLGTQSTNFSNAYQNVDDTLNRKDVLLSRIANDYIYSNLRPADATPAEPVHPDFPFPGNATYATLNSSQAPRQGRYIATANDAELRELFRNMARRILLRLAQ